MLVSHGKNDQDLGPEVVAWIRAVGLQLGDYGDNYIIIPA